MPTERVVSACLCSPGGIGPFDPSAADHVLQMILAPCTHEVRFRDVRALLVHPAPELAAGPIHPFDESLDLLGVGRALAGVARVDDETFLSLADTVLSE